MHNSGQTGTFIGYSSTGRLNARVMETAGKAFYGGKESACNGNSV